MDAVKYLYLASSGQTGPGRLLKKKKYFSTAGRVYRRLSARTNERTDRRTDGRALSAERTRLSLINNFKLEKEPNASC